MTTWALPAGPLRLDAATGATPLGVLREGLALGKALPTSWPWLPPGSCSSACAAAASAR